MSDKTRRTTDDERERRLAEHIDKFVSEAPPLTQETKDRIAALLRPVRERR